MNKIDAPELLVLLRADGKIAWDGVAGDCPENRSFAERSVRKSKTVRCIRYIPVEVIAEHKVVEEKKNESLKQ